MSTRPSVGVGILISLDAKILLVQRARAHGAGSWSTPGGHLEYGETPEQCAIREAKEEVGLDLLGARFKTLTNDVFAAEGLHYITIWMEATGFSGRPYIAAPAELTGLDWFPWDALPGPLFLPLTNLLGGRSYPPIIEP